MSGAVGNVVFFDTRDTRDTLVVILSVSCRLHYGGNDLEVWDCGQEGLVFRGGLGSQQ